MDLLIGTQEGQVTAYDSHGRVIQGFPLQTGGRLLASPTIIKTVSGTVGIAIGSDDHFVNAWQLSAQYDSTKMPWPMYLHDRGHSGYEGSASVVTCVSCLNGGLGAYNWPNPVGIEQNFKTHIRYFVRSNANVTIKIFDLAGDLVTEFAGPGVGGLDNEVEWDVTNIQSGVYFAHIDAQGAGASGSSIIKIAVIK